MRREIFGTAILTSGIFIAGILNAGSLTFGIAMRGFGVSAVADAAITYLEGYLWDPPHAKEAFVKAAGIAHKAGRKVALTLSDSFCVDRYRDEYVKLMRDKTVDIIFANENELRSLYQTADFNTALEALRADIGLAVVTRSEKGCVVVQGKVTERVPAAPINQMVDATGAGDLFAAGFLVGTSRGKDLRTSAQLGALAAAEVIQHVGARPLTPLKALAESQGFKL
jgi:adenosine kinase